MTERTSAFNAVSAPVFLLEAKRHGTFLAWNTALGVVSGLSSADMVGRTPGEMLGPNAAALSLSPPGLVNVPNVGVVVLERDGDVLVGTAQDRDREAFISMAAHDLRAPLRNILILAEMALSETSSDREFLAKITSVARNGLALTTDVVGSAQALAQGEQPMATLSLRELVQQIATSLDGDTAIDCSDVKITVEKPVLMIALRNLLNNAIRKGHVRRKIKIEANACEFGVEIRVLDNGTGFQETSLAFLAGGEFRLESGYGLFGLRRLLHARGGRVAVEPAETGKGSAVVMTLPGSVEGQRIAIAS